EQQPEPGTLIVEPQPGAPSTISARTLEAALAADGATVIVQTADGQASGEQGSIFVQESVSAAVAGESTLELRADEDIAVNDDIGASSGALNVVMSAGDRVRVNATVDSGTGDITVEAGRVSVTANGELVADGAGSIDVDAVAGDLDMETGADSRIAARNGAISLTAGEDVVLAGVSNRGGTGDITITAGGNIIDNRPGNNISATNGGVVSLNAVSVGRPGDSDIEVVAPGGVNASASGTGERDGVFLEGRDLFRVDTQGINSAGDVIIDAQADFVTDGAINAGDGREIAIVAGGSLQISQDLRARGGDVRIAGLNITQTGGVLAARQLDLHIVDGSLDGVIAGINSAVDSLSASAAAGIAVNNQSTTLVLADVSNGPQAGDISIATSNDMQVIGAVANAGAGGIDLRASGMLQVGNTSADASVSADGALMLVGETVGIDASQAAAIVESRTGALAVVASGGEIDVTGGSAHATLRSQQAATLTAATDVNLTAGSAGHAIVESVAGDVNVSAGSAEMTGFINLRGSEGFDAAIIAADGTGSANLAFGGCSGCAPLAANPLSNSVGEAGVFAAMINRVFLQGFFFDNDAGSFLWEDPFNWNADILPTSADDVRVDLNGDTTVSVGTGTHAVNALQSNENLAIAQGASLAIGGGGEITGNVDLAEGSALSVAGELAASGAFDNAGSVSIAANSSLNLAGGGTHNGAFDIASAGTLALTGGRHDWLPGASLPGNGVLNIAGGDATFGGDSFLIPNLELAGGTIDGSAAITIGNNFGWSGGEIRGGAQTELVIAAAAAMSVSSDGVLTLSRAFDNNGTVNVQTGALRLIHDGSHGGAFNVEADQALELAAGSTHDFGGAISGAGELSVNGAQASFDATLDFGGSVALNGVADFQATSAVGALSMSGGSLRGAGDLTVSGPLDWTGGVMDSGAVTHANGGLDIAGDVTLERTLNHRGAGAWSGNADVDGTGAFNNLEGAEFAVAADGVFAPTFNNTGNLIKEGDNVSTLAGTVANTGLIEVQAGELSVADNALNEGVIDVFANARFASTAETYTNAAGAVIGGEGVLAVRNLVNDGTLAPGGRSVDTTGTLTLSGDLLQSEGARLEIELAGTDGSDRDGLAVAGEARLGGAFDVRLVNEFLPQEADRFEVVTCGSGCNDLFSLNAPLGFSVLGSANNIVLEFFRQLNIWIGDTTGDWAVPENWSLGVVPNETLDVRIDTGNALTISGGEQRANSIQADGDLIVGDGSLDVEGASTFNGGLTLAGGEIGGAGDIGINDRFTWSGGLLTGDGGTQIGAQVVADVSGAAIADRPLDNAGAVNISAPGASLALNRDGNHGGMFNVAQGAMLDFNGSTHTFGADATIANDGVVNVNSSLLDFQSGLTQTGGVTNVNGGEIRVPDGFTLDGGTLHGGGAVTGDVVNNGGVFSPGGSPGRFTINGNYLQGENGTLLIELAGTDVQGVDYDWLEVTGNATLDGTLLVSLFGGFEGAIGDDFSVMTYSSVSGDFARVTVPEGYVFENGDAGGVQYDLSILQVPGIPPFTGNDPIDDVVTLQEVVNGHLENLEDEDDPITVDFVCRY
ncbi:MAG: beta strand repeat-containing protein, partial [Gammaproteobacteria bacterium]